MKISKEIRVAALAIVAIAVFYFGFNFLKGIDFLSSTKTYYVVYDNIGGLMTSNPVTINGFSVGRVNSITLMQEQDNSLLVELDINKEIVVGDSTAAVLTSDLLGGTSIVLEIGDTRKVLQSGDTLMSKTDKGLTEIIKEKTLPVIAKLEATILKINTTLEDFSDNGQKINKIIDNIETSTNDVRDITYTNKKRINNILKNVEELSASLPQTEEGINSLLASLNQLADSVQQVEFARVNTTLEQAEKALASLKTTLDNLNEGNGSMGKLLHSDSLYMNLNNTAADLDRLLIDLRENPGRYVHFSLFGRKEKENKK